MEDVKEYCHYTFTSYIRGNVLGAVPKQYPSRKIILDEFDVIMGYRPEYFRRFNLELIDAIKTVRIVNVYLFDKDTSRLYDSVFDRFNRIHCGVNNYDLDYEQLFDILADYLWVIASCDRDSHGKSVSLIANQSQICSQSQNFLMKLQKYYQDELETVAEMENVLSQESFSKSLFLGLQSKSYQKYLENKSSYELKKKIEGKKINVRRHQYLFYALCATNAKYKNLVKELLR